MKIMESGFSYVLKCHCSLRETLIYETQSVLPFCVLTDGSAKCYYAEIHVRVTKNDVMCV